jgi:hypothetical protein
VVHGIYIVNWDGKGRDAILSASFVGIHLYCLGKDGKWTRTEISKGNPAAWPKSGSSDVAVGHLGKQRYLAAIEPWHGNQVAIYHARKSAWERQVIDDSLVDGHTIWTGDLNADGRWSRASAAKAAACSFTIPKTPKVRTGRSISWTMAEWAPLRAPLRTLTATAGRTSRASARRRRI